MAGLGAALWARQQWAAKVRAVWSVPPAALILKPTRDLTPTEARDVVAYLVYSNQVSLVQDFGFDAATRITDPPVTKHVDINRPDIGGVMFLMPDGKPWHMMGNIQMAFLVTLWKLASLLKNTFSASAIFAGGLGVGDDAKPTSCHQHGHCIDFYGIRQTDGTELKVYDKWGTHKFTRPDGKVASCWPGDCGSKDHPDTDPFATRYFYRLDPAHSVGDVDAAASNLFQGVYTFAIAECRDNDTNTASQIGQTSFIMHPDNPHNGLRVHHQNHMHFQLGDSIDH